MASNQTEHYGLNQWAGTDQFVREEFNEDHRKIDLAIKTLEESSAEGLTAAVKDLLGRINELDAVKSGAVFGACTGIGQNITVDSVLNVELGFQPKAVIVATHGGTNAGQPHTGYAQIALPGFPSEQITVTETGFAVHWTLIGSPQKPNGYVAFR